MRQLTEADGGRNGEAFSKLPMRQLTIKYHRAWVSIISKLPMRQLTMYHHHTLLPHISKLPMRQLT